MAGREQYSKVGPYILMQTIGVGSFGKVKLAVHEKTYDRYACKVLDKNLVKERTLSFQVEKEITIMRRLRHWNTVTLVGVLSTSSKVFIIMELVTGGELFSEIERHKRLTENYARFYFKQLVEGVQYCHEHGIFHRDLKPENLLLDEHRTLKITDFGLSSFKVGSLDNGRASVTGSLNLHTQCGTPNYVAPEIIALNSDGYSGARADVWSCGIILYVLVAGALPFDASEMDTLFKLILKGDIDFPANFSDDLRHLIIGMLQRKPELRMKLSDVQRHPWFNGPVESCMPGDTPPPVAPGHPQLTPSETNVFNAREHGEALEVSKATHPANGDVGASESAGQSEYRDPASPSFKSSAPSLSSSSSTAASSTPSPPNVEQPTSAPRQSRAPVGTTSPLAQYQMNGNASSSNFHPCQSSILSKDSLDVTIKSEVVASEIVFKKGSTSDEDEDDGESDYYDEDAQNVSDYSRQHASRSDYACSREQMRMSVDDHTSGAVYEDPMANGDDTVVSQRISFLEPLTPYADNEEMESDSHQKSYTSANVVPHQSSENIDESDPYHPEMRRDPISRFRELHYEGNSDSSVQSSDEENDLHNEEVRELPYNMFHSDAPRDTSPVLSMETNDVSPSDSLGIAGDTNTLSMNGHGPATENDNNHSSSREAVAGTLNRRQLWDRDAKSWRPSNDASANGIPKSDMIMNNMFGSPDCDNARHYSKSPAPQAEVGSYTADPVAPYTVDANRQDGSEKQVPDNHASPSRRPEGSQRLGSTAMENSTTTATRSSHAQEGMPSGQQIAETNKGWMLNQKVWCHLMKDFDMIPDHVEFGMPSEVLSELWTKGLEAEGLGPKKSFMHDRFGPDTSTRSRTIEYLSSYKGTRNGADSKYRQRRRRYETRSPSDLRKPFPPSVQEKLERMERISADNQSKNQHTAVGNHMQSRTRHIPDNQRAQDVNRETVANIHVQYKEVAGDSKRSQNHHREVTDSNHGTVGKRRVAPHTSRDRGEGKESNSRRGRANVVTFASTPEIVIDRKEKNGAGNTTGRDILPRTGHDSENFEGQPSVVVSEKQTMAKVVRTDQVNMPLSGDDRGKNTVHGKDPPGKPQLEDKNRNSIGNISPTERMSLTTEGSGSASHTSSLSSKSKSSSFRDRPSSPPDGTHGQQGVIERLRQGNIEITKNETLDSEAWAESGTLSATSVHRSTGSEVQHSRSPTSLRGTLSSAMRSGGSEMMSTPGDHATFPVVPIAPSGASSSDGAESRRAAFARQNGWGPGKELIVPVSTVYEAHSSGISSGVTSAEGLMAPASELSPFDMNIPSPRGPVLPPTNILCRMPYMTAQLISRLVRDRRSPLEKALFQFVTVLRPSECYDVLMDALRQCGCWVLNKSRNGKRFKITIHWQARTETVKATLVIYKVDEAMSVVVFQRRSGGRVDEKDDKELEELFDMVRLAYIAAFNKLFGEEDPGLQRDGWQRKTMHHGAEQSSDASGSAVGVAATGTASVTTSKRSRLQMRIRNRPISTK